MKKEIVSIVMSTALLVNNVASPITVMADEVANTNNQTLEVADENNVENNESSEGDIESLNEETEVVKLESGKTYEIKNNGTNKISISNNYKKRDEVKYDKNGNIIDYQTNRDYSNIDLGKGEKIKIKVSTSDLCIYVPMDYKEDLEIKEIEGEVLSKVNLEAGKIYEIINKGQSSIYIKNNYNKREEAKYDKDGNMIYCDKNKEYSNMDLKSGEKIIVKVLNNDLFTYIPMDYKKDVEIIEFTEKQASIKLNVNAINMNSKKTQTLVAKLIDNNPFEPVELEWSSSNSDVATVDNNGKVTSVSLGSATITVKIKGTNISASCTVVVKDDLNKASVENISAQDYTGKKVEPKVVVKYGDKELQKNIDYTVEYTNNINPGNATVKITGKGNYYGEITKSFVIKEKTNNLSVALNGKDKINLIDNEYETKEFEISSILKNNNLYDMSDISITIELDNGLKLKDGQNKTINIGQLISGDQRTLSWTVQLDNSIYTEDDRNLGYEVIVKESNRDSVIVSKDVFVPGIKSNIDDSNNDNNNNNNNENNNVEVEVFNQLNILTIEQYDSIIEKIEAALQLKDEQGRHLFKLKNEEVQKEILSNGDEIHTYIIQELEYESAMQRALAIVGKVKKEYIIKIRVKKAVIKAIEDRNKGNLSNSSNSNNKPNKKPNSNNTTISSNTNVNKKPSSSLINSTTNKKPSNNSINSTTNKKPNSTSPKTGDAGILGYIGLAGIATSVLSRINRRKKD